MFSYYQPRHSIYQPYAQRLSPFSYTDYDDDGDDVFRYDYGFSPRTKTYLKARQQQEGIERARRLLLAEEERRRKQESYHRALEEVRLRKAEIEQEMKEESGKKQTLGSTDPPTQSQTMPSTPAPRTTPPVFTPEERDSAARAIQFFFRQHISMASIKALDERFDDLRQRFRFPSKVDFVVDQGQVISVDVAATAEPEPSFALEIETNAKLAYTSNNVAIHTYSEELSRLLVSLDAIESWGGKRVRQRRRDAVRRIEKEAQRIETVSNNIWMESRRVGTQDEGNAEVQVVDVEVIRENEKMEVEVEVEAAGDENAKVDEVEVEAETTTKDENEKMEVEVDVETTKEGDIKVDDDGVYVETTEEENAKVEVEVGPDIKKRMQGCETAVDVEENTKVEEIDIAKEDIDTAEVEIILAPDVETSDMGVDGDWTLVATQEENALKLVDSSQ